MAPSFFMFKSNIFLPLILLACLVACQANSGYLTKEINWDAFKSGTPQQVKAEVAKLLDIDVRTEDSRTLLVQAVDSNADPEVIAALLDAVTNSGSALEAGLTPLMVAAKYNPHPKAILVLLDAGADVHAVAEADQTLIMAAKLSPNPEEISLLSKAGSNASAASSANKTALDFAKENRSLYKTKSYWKLYNKSQPF